MLKTKYLLLCASLLFTSTVFTACDDDDDSSSSNSSTSDSTSEKLLKSTTETDYEVANGEIGASDGSYAYTYTYDSKGRVIGLTENDPYGIEKTVMTYNGKHVTTVSTTTEEGETTTEIDSSILLNDEGNVVRYLSKEETADHVVFNDTVFCSYENGFLVSAIGKKCNLTYTFENNCLKTSNDDGLVTYYYTDETTTTPIVRKGNWEGKFHMGKSSVYLPVKEVETSEGNTYYLKWTLNADGYPVKCEKRMYDSSNKLSGYSVNTYTWQ